MIDWQRQFHTGIRVDDIDEAMASLGSSLDVTWATVQHNPAQPIWTPDHGLREVPLTFTYSCEGPQHVELLQGVEGTPWYGGADSGMHHVGIWSDDVTGDTESCLANGWTVVMAGAAPEDGYGGWVYVVPPGAGRMGPFIELVWSAVEPRFDAWWSGGNLGNERT